MPRVKSNEQVVRVKKAFLRSCSRRTKEGYLIGIESLQNMLASLGEGDYDGLMFEFGIDTVAPGKPYVLVATEFKVIEGETRTVEYGKKYGTLDPDSPNPISVGSPPL